MAKLMLIDDDTEVLEINKKYLMGEGYQVGICSDPTKALDLIIKHSPDCIILDVMMPGLDGFTLCSQIRKYKNTPIIFLTGKGSEDDRINGLVTGGDDYLIKPVSLRELKVHIDVILRRSSAAPVAPAQSNSSNKLVFGKLTIDMLAHKAFFNEEDLLLANREYEVLLYLAQRPGVEVTFEELGTALFGTYTENDRRSVMVNVSRLRKKMAIDIELEDMIETVWSKGYKFTNRQ